MSHPSIGRVVVLGLLAASVMLPSAGPIQAAVWSDSDDVRSSARAYRAKAEPVVATDEGHLIVEAEEFEIVSSGWEAKRWGANYYAATFANTFLSRKAFLGAPEQVEDARARITVRVPEDGRYLVLARYEAAFRFETQFTIKVEQNGRTLLNRLYGARANPKIWAFRQKIKPEHQWSWGAVENVVWEGHDAFVDLKAGEATIHLHAGPQEGLAAKRNIDAIMLTTDVEQVNGRIERENFLPLDGMLTQSGDVWMRVVNKSDNPVRVNVTQGREHSPYWVHLRRWRPRQINAEGGATSDWVEVGSLLDTMNDGQWPISVAGEDRNYEIEIGLRNAAGEIEKLRSFASTEGVLPLVYHGDTRYSRQVRHRDEVLGDLMKILDETPVRGRRPEITVIHGYAFDVPDGAPAYTAEVARFVDMFAMSRRVGGGMDTINGVPRGYIDVRGQNPDQLRESMKAHVDAGRAAHIHTVSLGDEIGLASPPATDHAGFVAWARQQGLQPGDLGAADWDAVRYTPRLTDDASPKAYYHSRIYAQDFGIARQKVLTDVIREHLPNAGVGANYSPHHAPMYLGEVHKWATIFRREGMTMPWSEDYIWQIPVGSQQMNFTNLDMFRAGMRTRPEQKLHYYVMPHWPGNTVDSWRRQFYGDVAHGMKVVNLFEFRPVQAAYTENHVSLAEMFLEVRRSFYEMGLFEDIMQAGKVRQGDVGMWFSRTGDAWNNKRDPFGAAIRGLYVALLHQGVQLDFLIDEDPELGVLDDYKAIFVTETNVHDRDAKALADWVEAGGTLVVTAGGGSRNQYNVPATILPGLLGIEPIAVETPAEAHVSFIKQDLPHLDPTQTVTWRDGDKDRQVSAYSIISRFRAPGAQVLGAFSDGSPAITMRQVGQGRAYYIGFAPGLSYFHPAIPLRPVDRGSTDDAMSHYVPTKFDHASRDLLGLTLDHVDRPVATSHALVQAKIVEADAGMLVPVVNWSEGPIQGLKVTIAGEAPSRSAELASGGHVTVTRGDQGVTFTFDLDVADALILR